MTTIELKTPKVTRAARGDIFVRNDAGTNDYALLAATHFNKRRELQYAFIDMVSGNRYSEPVPLDKLNMAGWTRLGPNVKITVEVVS